MKTAQEKRAIEAIMTCVGLQILEKHLPNEVQNGIRAGMYKSRSKLVMQASDELLTVILSAEQVMTTLARKLLHCQNPAMLAHALMAVEAINTGNMYMVEEDNTLVSQGEEVSHE